MTAKSAADATYRLSATGTVTALPGAAHPPRPDQPSDLDTIEESGRTLANQGNMTAAESFFKRALALRMRMFGPEAPETLPALNKLALLYIRTNRFAQAESTLRQALSVAESASGALEDEAAMAHGLLGTFLADRGRADEGVPALKRALSIWTRQPPADPTRLAVVLDAYAKVLLGQGKGAEAEMFCRLAVKLFQKDEGESWRTAAAIANLGGLIAHLGREAEALTQLETARAMFVRLGGGEHWCVANVDQQIKAAQAQQAARARPH